MELLPLTQMRRRLKVDREDSDTAFFFSLMYYGELVVKFTTATLVAALQEDRELHRYRQMRRLVRADGIGEWHAAAIEILKGPTSQFLTPAALSERKEFTQRCSKGSWQYESVSRIHSVLEALGADASAIGGTVSCLQWLEQFVILRNKTRGHGAQAGSQLGNFSSDLEQSIEIFATNCSLFHRPWAYLKRNLSGKYRVTPLGGEQTSFQPLRSARDITLRDGVYVSFDKLAIVELVHSDPEASDFFFPNGGFTDKRYELVSYASGETQYVTSDSYLKPAERLPGSETEGLGSLDLIGNCFANLPSLQRGYVQRSQLEADLQQQLLLDRHPIISLAGPGGIGKTSLALNVLHDLMRRKEPPFDVLLWFSARDIDLLLQGPRTVRAGGVTLKDFGRMCTELLEPPERENKRFDSVQFLANQLTGSEHGRIFFIFDNFETVIQPAELYGWIDSFVRLPNKVLITTRIRGDFVADFPVEVQGMTEEECLQLISETAVALSISQLIDAKYSQSIVEESEGHPYVIKVLLGEVAKEGRAGKVERIIANREEILNALFERTYSSLSPAAQKTFLTLSSWRSTVPEIALQAVMLRPSNERITIDAATEELIQSSLVERLKADDGDAFLHVPLAASLFGRRKLTASPWKAGVDSDSGFLRVFGASQKSDVRHGISPMIDRFFKNVAISVSTGKLPFEEIVPTLKYVCEQYSDSWMLMADLYEEEGRSETLDEVKYCLQRYLEKSSADISASWIWKRLADICRDTGDIDGELHAISKMVEVPDLALNVLTSVANRINGRLAELTPAQRDQLPVDVKERWLKVLVAKLENRLARMGHQSGNRLVFGYEKRIAASSESWSR